MMYPLQLAVILMSLVYQLNAFSQRIPSDFVLLKTPYTFPDNPSSCERAQWRKSSPTEATIATYQNQTWRIEEGFREEFTWKENHLLLNSAKYTDQGYYEFDCNGVKISRILDVLYAKDVHVKEMDNITLDCYAVSPKDVTWLHNKERVLHYNGSIYSGEGYKGRVSLEENCFKTGDFSLTITGVRETDAGIYRCFKDDETKEGYPHTTYHLAHVNGNRSSPGDQTDSNCNEALFLRLAIVFGISFILTLILVIVKPELNCQSTSATATDPEPNSDENGRMMLEDIASPNNDNQPRVRPSVQESEPTENKPSNTKPF
ncbi:uncharacterized protein LOC120485506 isoform X2 [Pimephales promelas]|uniref:uncharacterized protein LOC120485506 isoform X2 n=1 Tax=Pimephales promelas TaxID=90988 RepID=UPI0019557E28|nr:uncharacterized protein LOC120485506 isoform X2 [Pimephales promelas]